MNESSLQLCVDRLSGRKTGHPDRPATHNFSGTITGDSIMKQRKLCDCGCGHPVSFATKTNSKRGDVKGQPVRYVTGHAARKRGISISFVVDKTTGCWIWQGAKISTGYGHLRVQGKNVLSHRYMYEKVKGEIPGGLELDHLCRNPLCMNPQHLEPVTHAENCRRGKRVKLTHRMTKQIKAMAENGQRIEFIAAFYKVDRRW